MVKEAKSSMVWKVFKCKHICTTPLYEGVDHNQLPRLNNVFQTSFNLYAHENFELYQNNFISRWSIGLDKLEFGYAVGTIPQVCLSIGE